MGNVYFTDSAWDLRFIKIDPIEARDNFDKPRKLRSYYIIYFIIICCRGHTIYLAEYLSLATEISSI